MCSMSIDILLAIDYNVLVRNKRESTKKTEQAGREPENDSGHSRRNRPETQDHILVSEQRQYR